MTTIQKRRFAAKLTQGDVAAAVDRSTMWISRVERGLLPIDGDTEARILLAIERLVAHRERMRLDREKTVEDLRLPRCAAI